MPNNSIDEVPTICPACHRKTTAVVFEQDGKIYQQPRCQHHETKASLVFSDAGLFRKLEAWNELIFEKEEPYPAASLYSPESRNPAMLGIIDLTDRCNFACPLCFAETDKLDDGYYLELETVRGMLLSLLNQKPVPCLHVQFSGGEPTLHPKFPEILKMSRDLGFNHIQVATNGTKLLNMDNVELYERMGLQTIYLQFDSMNDDVYNKLRSQSLVEKKIRIVENIARSNMRLVLVPSILAGLNEDQIGPIFRFALQFSKQVTGISFQPVTMVGRLPGNGNGKTGFNLADMAHEFDRQTGLTSCPEDWFPLNAVSLLTHAVAGLRGEDLNSPACDSHCSLGTYFYIDEQNRPTCVNRFLDMDKFFKGLRNMNVVSGRTFLGRKISQLSELRKLSGCLDMARAPEGLTFQRLLQGLEGWEDKATGRAPGWASRGFNGMFVAGMHFMDSSNYSFRRLKRCIIQYVILDGRRIPFCSYNAGDRYRDTEERKRKNSQKENQVHAS